MTPNHGHDPNDPRAQHESPGQQPSQHHPASRQGSPQQQLTLGQGPPGQGQPQPTGPPSQSGGPGMAQQPGGPSQQQPAQSGHPASQTGANQPPGGQNAHPTGAMQSPPQQQAPQQSGPQQQAPLQRSTPQQQAPPRQPGPQRQAPPQQQPPHPTQSRGQGVLQPITVDEIANEDVATAERDTPVRTIVASMAERDFGSVIIVEAGKPIGIVTDRKVALSIEETPDITTKNAEEVMSESLMTVDSSTNIFEVVRRMGDNGIRRIPVVDENGKLEGIVTLDDAIVLLGTELGNVAEAVREQIDRL